MLDAAPNHSATPAPSAADTVSASTEPSSATDVAALIAGAADMREPGRFPATVHRLLRTVVGLVPDAHAVTITFQTHRDGAAPGQVRTLAAVPAWAADLDTARRHADTAPVNGSASSTVASNPPASHPFHDGCDRGRSPSTPPGEVGSNPTVVSRPLALPAGFGASLNLYFAPPHGHSPHLDTSRHGEDELTSRPAIDTVEHATGLDLVTDLLSLALTSLLHQQRADHLTAALDSNRVIGTAMGVLMTRHRWTPAQAFDALRHLSQNSNRKLRDIAEDVALTGTLPA